MPSDLRAAARRARIEAETRPFSDPADQEQLRYFAEWCEHEAEAREMAACASAQSGRRIAG